MNPQKKTSMCKTTASLIECEDSALSDDQLRHLQEIQEEYKNFLNKVDDMMLKQNAEIVEKGKHITIYELDLPPKQFQTSVKSEDDNLCRMNIALTNGIIATPVSPVFNGNSGTYKLVVASQPKMNLLSNSSNTTSTNSNSSPTVTSTSPRPNTPRVQIRPGLGNINNIQIAPKRVTSSATAVTMSSPKTSTVLVKTTTSSTPSPILAISARNKGKSITSVSLENVQSKFQSVKSTTNAAAVVDLTHDDGKGTSDVKDTTTSRTPSRLYPSLVVVARPNLRTKEMTSAQIATERNHLDTRVKGILTNSATKFTEWLIQQGLVRSEQYCSNHSPISNTANRKLQLGMYNDASRFPYSGGYVWISECCPQKFVSVFCNSIFDGAPHSPTVLLKLIYHWACQTNVHNIIMWVKVDHLYIKNFFTNLRAICTAAVCEKFGKLGGPNKKLEVGVISLGTTCNNGNVRQVKVEVLGVMDPVSKFVRLRAVDPVQNGDKNNEFRFSKILESLKLWVHPSTIIVTDFTVDKSALQALGFSNVLQANPDGVNNKDSNKAIMDYLKRVVPRMFQNTLSLLSRSIIQQFLDELVWRERWGSIPSRAFDMLVAHISEVTRLDTGDSLINRLKLITTNPFKDWSYRNWKSNCDNITRQLRSDLSTSNNRNPKKSCNSNPTTIAPKLGTSRTVVNPSLDDSSDETKSFSSSFADMDDDNNSATLNNSRKSKNRADETKGLNMFSTSLEKYYYGTLPPDGAVISKVKKVDLNMKCFACGITYNNNIKFLKHLAGHAQNEGAFTTDHQCRYCLKNFTSDLNLEDHYGNVHFPNRYNCMCLICGQRFRTRSGIITHMQNNHVELELPYQCNICKYRTSVHTKIIDHFYDVHDGGEKVQCPFCLKVVSFESSNGTKINQNVEFFFYHLQRHQKKPCKRCTKCVLAFVNKNLLKEHTNKDHVSCNHITGIIRHDPSFIETTLMPPPFSSAAVNRKTKSVVINISPVSNRSLDNSLCYPNNQDMKCLECKMKITASDHFTSYLRCMKCMFASCCSNTMNKHMEKYHDVKSKRKVVDRKPMILPNPLYCVCGYSSTCGNVMASHLVQCKRRVVYRTLEKASQNAVSAQSASFPPLVNLDDVEDDLSEVSGKWLRALVKSGSTENEEMKSKRRLLSDNNPPPFLGELGLVRKDVCVQDGTQSSTSSMNRDEIITEVSNENTKITDSSMALKLSVEEKTPAYSNSEKLVNTITKLL